MWGELALAGMQLASAYAGARSSESAQASANEQNIQLMDHQNALNVQNYQHRHQWEVQDLISAGLNPILSANSAASVPGASMATVDSTRPSRGEMMISAAKSLADVALTRAMVKTEQTKQEVNRAQTDSLSGQFRLGPFSFPLNRLLNWFNSARSSSSAVNDKSKSLAERWEAMNN